MSPPGLAGRLVRRAELSADCRARLCALMQRHFAGVERDRFDADLDEKDWVLLFTEADGTVQGFSTLLKYHASFRDRAVTVIYSGDTIVDERFWGSRALPRTWIRAVRSLHAADDPPELYWLLLTAGYRTYRFLPLFWREFFPRCDGGNDGLRCLRDRLASRRFGAAYDPATGVVRLPGSYHLAPRLAQPPPGRRHDPHIDFFLRCNPGHVRGDELVCIASLDEANLTGAGRRMCG